MAPRSKAKRLLLALLVLGLLYGAQAARSHLEAFLGTKDSGDNASAPEGSPSASTAHDAADDIRRLFQQETSGIMVQAPAQVIKTLPDDNEGSRHQRFIVELSNGHTVLISHNIDLAERVPLREGDELDFKGQFEWNERGGVVHWTHKDPAGRHEEGWVRHAGVVYE